MSATQLVIATPNSSLRNSAGLRMAVENPQLGSNDMVLTALTRLITLLGGVARRRRQRQIARNRVEARRELAKLPKRVRDDVMFTDPPINHHV